MPGRMVPATDREVVPLGGLGVLLTRPAGQAEPLCHRLEQAGARVIRFPTLEIVAPPDACDLSQLPLDRYGVVIFISVNAVQWGLRRGPAAPQWPQQTRIAAIGRSTAAALRHHGLEVALQPAHGFTSEDFLALESLQDLTGRSVLIVRGVGGREVLAEALRARGAQVDYAQVYQRRCPQVDVEPLLDRWRTGEIQAITVTSGESLRNLWELLGEAGQALMSGATLVVASERIAETARDLGCQGEIRVADDATDDAMFTTLLHLAQASR